MTRSSLLALCSAVALPQTDDVPEWIHLLPAGQIRTSDGRGPYAVHSMQEIADASLKTGQKLPLDENHSTDKAAPHGQPSPARGWIVELQARDDGLWGKVDWNPSGRALMLDKAYNGISPVIVHTKDKKVLGVVRASLTNTANLVGLTALHSEESEMDLKTQLIEQFGLDSNADDATIVAALKAKTTTVAPQAQDLLEHPTVIALQAQNTELAGTVKALVDGQAKRDAETYVDGAIAAGRVGLKPVRDEYIALHMSDPDKARKLIEAMPAISGRTNAGDIPPANGETSLTTEDRQVMALFNVDEETYKAGLVKAGLLQETL